MTWSYSLATLSTTPKDQVRLLVGDTNTANQQIQDEEIDFILGVTSSIYGAGAECCFAIAASYSSKADQSEGDISIKYSQLAKAYMARGAQLRNTSVARGGAVPYSGGISVADKLQQEQNPDRVGPQFTIGIDDSYLPVPSGGPETGSTSSDPSQT